MQKVLFIMPPIISFDDFIRPSFNVRTISKKKEFGGVVTDMPTGILALSAYIKKHLDVEVKLLDFNTILAAMDDFTYDSFEEFFYDKFTELKKEFIPDIIGISVLFTPSYDSSITMSEKAKNIFKNALVLLGGGVPSNMYKDIFLATNYVDGICYGEGEKALVRLLKSENKYEFMESDPSWITKNKTNQSFGFDFIDNLDEIPPLDYDLCDRKMYDIHPTIITFPSIAKYSKVSNPIMVSRGCVFKCNFCSSHTVHGREMRYNSLERVREDLINLRDNYGTKMVTFLDDHFMGDKKRAFGILRILQDLNLKAFFPNSLALYALSREMLESLRAVGVDQLVLAVESGSDRVLQEIIHKPLNLKIVEQVVKDCRELGIYSDANIITGLPRETKKDIEDAKFFLKTLDVNWFRINTATPLIGSDFYNECEDDNLFTSHHTKSNYKNAVINTGEFSQDEIQDNAYSLNLFLNFVHNSDMQNGRYDSAIMGFDSVLRLKSDHPFALYYRGKSYEKLGEEEKAKKDILSSKSIISNSEFWKKHMKLLNIDF